MNDFNRCTKCGVSDQLYDFHQKCTRCFRDCMCGRSRVEVAAIRAARAIDNALFAVKGIAWNVRNFFSRCEDCGKHLKRHERDYRTCETCFGGPR
jgi:hypothetical protein